MGLLDAITDPVLMAQIEERGRIARRVADQMGVSIQEAKQALDWFEANTSREGQTLN